MFTAFAQNLADLPRLEYNRTVMVISVVAALAVLQSQTVKCPVMPTSDGKASMSVEYSGAKISFCCGGCDTKFKKEPAKYLADATKTKTVVGEFLFDPVSRNAVKKDRARGSSDHKGIRYYFASTANKTAFDKEPDKFTKHPTKETLVCPVMDSPIKSQSAAVAYADHAGVRYYLCCTACVSAMASDAAKYAKSAKGVAAIAAK